MIHVSNAKVEANGEMEMKCVDSLIRSLCVLMLQRLHFPVWLWCSFMVLRRLEAMVGITGRARI